MASEIKIPSTYHVKLSDLTAAEQRSLKRANANKKGCWEPTGAQEADCAVPNKEVLDEGELRTFLQKYSKNKKALSLLTREVPSLVAETNYEFSVVTKKKFQEVQTKLAGYCDKKIAALAKRTGRPTMQLDLMAKPDQVSKDWFSYFGADAWLAFGIFQKAYEALDPALKIKEEVFVSVVNDFLAGMRDQVKKVEAKGFITERVFDPIKDSDGNGSVEFTPTVLETRQRGEKISQYLSQLGTALNRIAADYYDQKTTTRDTMTFCQSVVEQSEVSIGAKEPDITNITRQIFALAMLYYRDGRLDANQVLELSTKLSDLAQPAGYHVKLETRDDLRAIGLFLSVSPIEQIQYFNMNLPGETEKEALAPFYLLPKTFSLTFEQNFGATLIPENISFFVGSYASSKIKQREHEAKEGSWELQYWLDSISDLSETEKAELIIDYVKYHEMIHNWMSRNGDLPEMAALQQADLKSYEGPAIYGNISHAQHPIAALAFLLTDRIVSLDGSTKARQFFPEYPESSVGQELFFALAVEYGVEVPKNLENRNKTDWIQELFKKIEESANTREAREAILRTQVALAYQKRYGTALLPFEQATPQRVVNFDVDFSTVPSFQLEESEQEALRLSLANNLEELGKKLAVASKEGKELNKIQADQYYFGIVQAPRGAPKPYPARKHFTQEQIKKLGGYHQARFVQTVLGEALEQVDYSSFFALDSQRKIDLLAKNLNAMAQHIRQPVAYRVTQSWTAGWEDYQKTEEYQNMEASVRALRGFLYFLIVSIIERRKEHELLNLNPNLAKQSLISP